MKRLPYLGPSQVHGIVIANDRGVNDNRARYNDLVHGHVWCVARLGSYYGKTWPQVRRLGAQSFEHAIGSRSRDVALMREVDLKLVGVLNNSLRQNVFTAAYALLRRIEWII